MSDYLYRCSKCGMVRMAYNLGPEPPRTLDCYCANCLGDVPVRHIHVPDTRINLFDNGTRVTILHTDNEDATLVICTEGQYTLLDSVYATRLAAFIDYEMFGQEESE